MTSTATDIRLEMLSCVQTGNGIQHDDYNICCFAHVCTYRKDSIFMQRQLLQSFIYLHTMSKTFTACVNWPVPVHKATVQLHSVYSTSGQAGRQKGLQTGRVLHSRVGYSPGTREPGSHKIFRLTRNFCSI